MKRPLISILVVSCLMALAYAWATPLGAAPDETAHLKYVEVLAAEGRLPSLNLTERRESHNDPNYESHQPPLYYALAVPFYRVGKILAGDFGPGQACRLLSILIGLGGTALVWLLAREVAPEQPALGTAAAGLAAFLPMRLSVMASVSNDSLAEATSSLALLIMLRGLRLPWSATRALGLGCAIAAALLAKQSAIVLLPTALAAVYFWSRDRTITHTAENVAPAPAAPRRLVIAGAAVAAAVLVLSGWWFIRNHVLYGDPLGLRAFNWYFEDTPRWASFRDAGMSYGTYWTRMVLPTAFGSFWGAFGHLDPARPDLWLGAYGSGPPGAHWGYPPRSWIYPILLVAMLVSAAGGIRAALRWRAAGYPAAGGVGILALHALFVIATFLNFNSTYFQAQGRYLFPAIGLISIALTAGWLSWAGKCDRAASWGIVSAALALAAYACFGVLLPGFGRPT